MKPVIEVEYLYKTYQKGIDKKYKSLRDTIITFPKQLLSTSKETFNALEDISFTVQAGESIGIIGRNGAGKSTLLKILSRITPPTKGTVTLRGRVASLLEVGTGFHPELTGRENIYFNGSILGMRNAEIKRKFDEIVDFSGVESFIDTPLKHYSSGMQMRLAFSVAAHLDAEILLIDEVLAVGDAEFQKKCIGKMDEVSKSEGKTVVFVSHNFNLISKLCEKSILLNKGAILETGSSSKVIQEYLSILNLQQEFNENEILYSDNNLIKIIEFNTINRDFQLQNSFNRNEDVGIKMVYTIHKNSNIIRFGINIHNAENVNVFDSHFTSSPFYKTIHPDGKFEAISWIPNSILKAGEYYLSFGFFNHQTNSIFARGKFIRGFNIKENSEAVDIIPGIINPKIEWKLVRL